MSGGFTDAINKMSGGEVRYTYKDLKDVLACALSIVDNCESVEVLNEEDLKLFNTVKSWNENSKDASKIRITEALKRQVNLLVRVGTNKIVVDVNKYSTLREAIDNIIEKIYITLGDDIDKSTAFLIDFKGSTFSFNYIPKDTEYINFKIEEGLHKLLKKHF